MSKFIVVAANIVCLLLSLYLIIVARNIFWGGMILALLLCELVLYWTQVAKRPRSPPQ